jgi:hypothetical protein
MLTNPSYRKELGLLGGRVKEQKFINFKDLNSYLLIKFSKNSEVK